MKKKIAGKVHWLVLFISVYLPVSLSQSGFNCFAICFTISTKTVHITL